MSADGGYVITPADRTALLRGPLGAVRLPGWCGCPAVRAGSGCQRRRVARLVEGELRAVGQPDRGQQAPALVGDLLGDRHALGPQAGERLVDVVAHQVQLMAALAGGVHGKLGRWHGEDEPAAARVHRGQPERVGEECPDLVGFGGERDRVQAGDHDQIVARDRWRPGARYYLDVKLIGEGTAVIHHVQLACPPGSEPVLREFYGGVLGLDELDKPPGLAARGGCWFRGHGIELHLGVEEDFRPARKAHPGVLVAGLDAWAARLRDAGYPVRFDDEFPACAASTARTRTGTGSSSWSRWPRREIGRA